MNHVEQKIWSLLQAGVEDLNLRLVQVRVSGGDDHCKLQIMIEPMDSTADNQLSVTVKECSQVSRMASAIMDVEDPISSRYNLEVSSTGLERPLVSLEDFKNYQGYRIRIEMSVPFLGQRKFRGVLSSLDGENIIITDEKTSEEVSLDFSGIKFARLSFTSDEINHMMNTEQLN